MRSRLRFMVLPAALALGGWLALPRPATAGGNLQVVVAAPHAVLAASIRHPDFPVGYVVQPYAHRVFYRRGFGYGFWAPVHGVRHAHFVRVRHFRTGWIVVPAPGHRNGW